MYPGPVTLATKSDEDELMCLCRQLYSENALFSMNDNKVRTMLGRAFNHEGGIIGVIRGDQRIEGVIFMIVSTFWYSDDPHLEELFLYVPPEYRKTKNALELMNFAKWCSAQSNFPLLIGVLSNERTAGKIRLYQRQFEQPAGNFFFYKKAG